jgi:glycosyltransferase involved in cell wall biosynthesis
VAIHGLCIVKNEADVIAQTMRAASRWCDYIYVFDNGSHDRTWEIVLELAQELPAVVPFKQDAKPFTDCLRGEILRHYRSRARIGDWWAVVDADEFCIDDPRAFLAQVPDRYQAVWPQRYSYVFTDIDAYCYQQAPGSYGPEIPLTERLNHYMLGEYSELRFFRHNPRLTEIPADIGPIYPERIRMRHFGYRSPDQISIRLETRREPMERGEFIHEKSPTGCQGVAPPPDRQRRRTCHAIGGNGLFPIQNVTWT